jgi:tetratricopeptide (TPR) repeat protein
MNRFAIALMLTVCAGRAFPQKLPPAHETNEAAVVQAYAAKYPECLAANNQQRWDDAVKLCSELDTIASRFVDEAKWHNEIREAYLLYGEALALDQDVPSALKTFHAATALADKYLKPAAVQYGTAYYWQAFAEHGSGDDVEADADYKTAEDSFRKAMEAQPEMKEKYGKYLAKTLSYHGILLEHTGRADEAKRLKSEAKTLDPTIDLGQGPGK